MTVSEYWLWLNNVPDMWHGKIRKLMDFFETPEDIYRADRKLLMSSGMLKEKDADVIVRWKESFDIKGMEEYLDKNSIKFITVDDDVYPERLKRIYDSPYCLYVKGQLPAGTAAVAIVGARDCTGYGIQVAKKIGKELGESGVDVISGMARGIDTYGHLGALEGGGSTYGVLGCGVDICYPSENIELYERIVAGGGIISEFPPGTKPLGWRFPQRNRIISGLSDCVAVVEAKAKSGSLITAELALEQGIDVFALPGRVTDILSEGCNKIIRDGAAIITDTKDILISMGIEKSKNSEILNNVLEKDFELVYSETDLFPVSFEELVARTGRTSEQVYDILLKLQMKNLIFEPVKNYYVRKM